MTSSDVLILVALAILLLLLIVLAAAETALNRISHIKAQTIYDTQPSRASGALLRLVEHPERFINPLLVTVTALQIGQTTLLTILAVSLFGPWGALVGFVVNLIVFFVLAESMPKTWAILHTERAGLGTARLVSGLAQFPPLRLISRGLIGLTNILLPGKGLKQGPFVSEQELLGIVEAAAKDEVIEHEERELIESIIEFGDTVAREIMVPRHDMVTVDGDASVTAALDLAIAHGNSRLPIRGGEDGDDIVGIVYTKDLIRAEREGRGDTPASDLSREPEFIPENKSVARLMREMQAQKFHLAIVADEYGGVVGLVTLEDCLEELVGEIVDEYDIEELAIRPLPDGEYLVEGGVQVEELNDVLEARLPDEAWDTVGGLLFGTLEHVPEQGESVDLGGYRFSAEELDGRRIKLVRVTKIDEHVVAADDVGPTAANVVGSATDNGTG